VRVVRVITRLNVGGPAIQAITLSERLSRSGYDTLLLHGRLGPGEGDMRYLQTDPALVTRYLDHLRRPVAPPHDLAALAQIYRALCRFRPALVHTHMAKAGTLGRIATLAYNATAGRSAPARIVHTYHGHVLEGYFSARTTRWVLAIERILARHTDAIVAISPRVRDELVDTYHIGRAAQYQVIPLGFDLDAFARIDDAARQRARDAMRVPAHASVVATVGRLTAIKRHQLFLQVAAMVAARLPETVFLIAGDGELRDELESSSRQLGLESRVRFLGWRRDLATIYAATDVFVLTSRNEGTPVALIESMACGVPGVSTDIGGIRDVIASPDMGVAVGSDDAAALSEHVVALLDHRERRRLMGACAREWVLERYGVVRLVHDITGLYQQLLSS
jgi:glycosyltransferase involved in cell wall biosynthesis